MKVPAYPGPVGMGREKEHPDGSTQAASVHHQPGQGMRVHQGAMQNRF